VYRGQPTLKYRLCSTLERAFEDFEVREDDRAEIERRILMDWEGTALPAKADDPEGALATAFTSPHRRPAYLCQVPAELRRWSKNTSTCCARGDRNRKPRKEDAMSKPERNLTMPLLYRQAPYVLLLVYPIR
jgi:hypothetical protein